VYTRIGKKVYPLREDRRFSREKITTVVVGPVSCANDGDDDEDDEDWEDEEEEEEEKKGEEDDEDDEDDEEEDPLWSAPDGHEGDGRSPPRRSEI
jgi:hypothetical protein